MFKNRELDAIEAMIMSSICDVLNEAVDRGIHEALFSCYQGRYEKWLQLELINALHKKNPAWKIEAEKDSVKRADLAIRSDGQKLISLKVFGSSPTDAAGGGLKPHLKQAFQDLKKYRRSLLLYIVAFNNDKLVPSTMTEFKCKVQELEECGYLNDFNIMRIDMGGGTVEKGFAFLLAELVDKKT